MPTAGPSASTPEPEAEAMPEPNPEPMPTAGNEGGSSGVGPGPGPTAGQGGANPEPEPVPAAGGSGGTPMLPDGFGVIASSPDTGAMDVDPATDIVLEFSESIDSGPGDIILSDEVGAVETMPSDDPRVTVDGRNVSIDLNAILGPLRDHTLTVESDAFVAASGDALETELTLEFRTAEVELPGGVDGGLRLWLDATYVEGITSTDGDVARWADRSGNHTSAVQSDVELQPRLDEDGLNGKAALSFDGRDDFLLGPTLGGSASYEGFVVWESMLAPGSATALLMRSRGRLEVSHGHVSPAARRAVSVFAGSQWSTATFRTPPMNAPTLWSFAQSAETRGVYARSQGGAPVFTELSAAPSELDQPLSFGAADDGTAGLLVRISEVLFYDRVLSSEERTAVNGYLREKWGVPDPACGSNQTLGIDGSCYFVTTEASSFDEAKASCEALGLGWHLASVRSEAENAQVAGLVTEAAWLSASATTDMQWTWGDDGSPFWSGDATGEATGSAFTAWASGEPSSEACAQLEPSGEWVSTPCSSDRVALCQGPGN